MDPNCLDNTIDPEKIRPFEDEGYAVVEGALSADEVAALTTAADYIWQGNLYIVPGSHRDDNLDRPEAGDPEGAMPFWPRVGDAVLSTAGCGTLAAPISRRLCARSDLRLRLLVAENEGRHDDPAGAVGGLRPEQLLGVGHKRQRFLLRTRMCL